MMESICIDDSQNCIFYSRLVANYRRLLILNWIGDVPYRLQYNQFRVPFFYFFTTFRHTGANTRLSIQIVN